MSDRVAVYTTLAILVLSFALPTGAALSVDGQSIEYTVDDEKIDIDQDQEGIAHVEGALSTGEHGVRAETASCQVSMSDETPEPTCQGPRVETESTMPVFDVDVDVDVNLQGDQPQSPESGISPERRTSISTYASDPFVAGLAIATAVASAGLVSGYAIWRGLRLLAFAGFAPLYSHIRDDEMLDDPNRSRIFTLIRDDPGASTKDIADRLDLAWGTVTHHLMKLEKRRFIVSKKYGKYRRFFVNGAIPGADGKDAVAVLRVEKTADIASFIRENPGLTQKEVSAAVGVSPSTVLWHVKRLERAGLVEKVRAGKHVKYFGTPTLDAEPAPAPTPQGSAPFPITS